MNMSATVKSTKPEIIDLTVCPVACAALYQKGIERAVEAGKISLDTAVQQNAEIVAAIKKALKGTSVPGMFILDLAAQAFEGIVSVQKQLMDLGLEQCSAALEALKNFDLSSSDVKADLAGAFEASLDRSLAAQNTVVEFAAKQTKAASEAIKQQPGIAGTAAETMADSVQRSFDTVLGVQKEMLSIAVKPLKAAARA
jgi:hypothetical protein